MSLNADACVGDSMKCIPCLAIVRAQQSPSCRVSIFIVSGIELIAVDVCGRGSCVFYPSVCALLDGGVARSRDVIVDECVRIGCIEGCGECSASVCEVCEDVVQTLELPPVYAGSCTRCNEVEVVDACHGLVNQSLNRSPCLERRHFAALHGAQQDAFRGIRLVEINIDGCCVEGEVESQVDVRCGFVAKVNTTITDVVAAPHLSGHSAIILVGIAFVGDRSVTDVVEVFCLVLCIGVVIIDDTEVAIEGCRDASHVTFVAKVFVAVSFFVPEVLFRFCKPC